MNISMLDLIEKKKHGIELSCEEIKFFVNTVTTQSAPDYQISAFLMAVYFNSLTREETVCLTKEMACSGDMTDLSSFGNLTVDKHSTGGVGDKITLVLAPLVASMGCIAAKMSGRGLGFTGGTIDKLHSIEGFNTDLTKEDFMSQLSAVGAVVAGQTGDLVPADKKMYALRDVTATVDIIPLIASSVMCKKLAGGAKNILLDVKCGKGAFMKTPEDAKALARIMVDIAKDADRNAVAVITAMNQPIGTAVGNSLEVREAVDVLLCKKQGAVRELSLEFAARLYAMSYNKSYEESYSYAVECLDNGKAYEKFTQMVKAQGGKVDQNNRVVICDDGKFTVDVFANTGGYVSDINGETIGRAAMMLGAGRQKTDDIIDYGAGITMHACVSDKINKGDKIATLYHNKNDSSLIDAVVKSVQGAFEYTDKAIASQPIIIDTVF